MAQQSILALKKEVLARLKPGKEAEEIVDEAVSAINKALKSAKIKAECTVGGSFAKKTNLKDDFDVDLFVRFEYSKYFEDDKKGGLPVLLEKILKKTFKGVERVHGSRDYFHLKKGGFNFEVVPVLKIDDPKKAVNVTDMTPMHVAWVLKHKMGDEIMITKAFCKAAKCYGAESYIKGFSGHVLDILTIFYGSFEKLMKAASSWDEEIKKPKNKGKIVIDFYNKHKGMALDNLNQSKMYSPLIIIDPVLPARNASAALSREKFDLFIESAKKFMKKPGIEFFEKKGLTKEDAEKKAGKDRLIFIEAEALKGKEDVVGAKLLKAFEFLGNQLEENDLKLKDSKFEFDKNTGKSSIYFILDKKELPTIEIRQGPPLSEKMHCEHFKKKYKDAFEKGKRLYAKTLREYTNPEALVKDLIKDEYVKERVKSIRIA